MDMILTSDGSWHRILGNWRSIHADDELPAYTLYRPSPVGDRSFRGVQYEKRRTPTSREVMDVRDTFIFVRRKEVIEHIGARTNSTPSASWAHTEWGYLYTFFQRVAPGRVGILGSSLIGDGIHCSTDSAVRNDVDFFIEGLDFVDTARASIGMLVKTDRAQPYSPAALRVMSNHWDGAHAKLRKAMPLFISRRWGGFEFFVNGRPVENTLRIRDSRQCVSIDLFRESSDSHTVEVHGLVCNAEDANIFPRQFTLRSHSGTYRVVSLWWQLPSFVRNGDAVTVCGDLINSTEQVSSVRISNYRQHWIIVREQRQKGNNA